MQLSGEVVVGAPPDAVWAALTDPALLCRLVPGCESFRGSVADGFDVAASRVVGGLTIRLAGRIELADVEPGRGCRLRAAGEGGGMASASGQGRVRLRAENGATRLAYAAEARLEGRLAHVPGFVVRLVARGMIDRFFERFRLELQAPARRA